MYTQFATQNTSLPNDNVQLILRPPGEIRPSFSNEFRDAVIRWLDNSRGQIMILDDCLPGMRSRIHPIFKEGRHARIPILIQPTNNGIAFSDFYGIYQDPHYSFEQNDFLPLN